MQSAVKIECKGAMPNIPPKANRRWKNFLSPALYRNRNALERMFGRLKYFRRIATRYDRLADRTDLQRSRIISETKLFDGSIKSNR